MAEKNFVPNLEAKASDGNPIFTKRQWLERFRQFTKREHKIDITPLVKGDDITEAGWTTETETQIQEDFIWGVGPEALYQITRAEYKTEPDSIKIKDLIRLYTEHNLPKRNTYHNRGDFFWAKQSENETPEEFWRRLIELEKECNFGTISAEELLISKYMTAITDKKLPIKKAEFNFMLDLKTLISKTAIDPEMTPVRTSMRREERDSAPEGYRAVFDKLSVRWGLVFVDDQIAVPIDLRRRLIEILHFGHSGITQMLSDAKISWWPEMRKGIEQRVKDCTACLATGKNLKYQIPKNKYGKLEKLSEPGQEIQIDFTGKLHNKNLKQ